MPGPLTGVKILDLTTVLMGPFATQTLGDMGADIIKIESVEGDVLRHTSSRRNPGMGNLFLNCNRNKRSIVLNLKHADGRAALLKLVETADVLVCNVRPQAMARLKLGYEDLCAANPKIIHVGCFGFGQQGPYAARAAYDDLIQGMCGSADVLGRAFQTDPQFVPINYVDRVTGLNVANAILAALFHRERHGIGQAVEVPMFETMVHFVMGEHLGGATFVPQMGEMGYQRIMNPYRKPYATKDGFIATLVYNDKQWSQFLPLIGMADQVGKGMFANMNARSDNIAAVYKFVGEEFAKRTTAEWQALLATTDIPFAVANTLEDVLEDPHLKAVGFFREFDHPTEGRLRMPGIPQTWSKSQPDVRRHAPSLGEHSNEILREAGYDDAAIAAMRASGATA